MIKVDKVKVDDKIKTIVTLSFETFFLLHFFLLDAPFFLKCFRFLQRFLV